MLKSLVLVVIFFGSLISIGQKYPFVTYSTEQGLPQSQVTSFVQDEKGYLWIGTLGGLAKFGGSKFITYSSSDGLLNNRVASLDYFDKTLWIGQDGGISFIRDGKFSKIEFEGNGNDRSRKVSKIINFKGKILVCSIGGGLFELKGGKLVNIPLSDEAYNWIRGAYIYKDQLYLATREGILVTDNGNSYVPYNILGKLNFSGIAGSGDEMVFSSFLTGVFIRNMKTGEIKTYNPDELKYNIQGCYFDRSNRIWLNTSHGIVQIDNDRRINFFDDSNGLPVNAISGFYHDNTDNIWIGSQGKGMFRFPSSDFKYYDETAGFPSDLFLGGFQDKKGDYYFSTLDKGVFRLSQSGEIIHVIDDDVSIWAALNDLDGKHWFGGISFLAEVSMDGSVIMHTSEENDNIPGVKITALYRISNTSMYIGGNGGVSIYENGTFRKLGTESNKNIGTVRDFEIVDGKLYCVTNLGLYVYENDEFKIAYGVKDLVYNLERDNSGALWFGTEEGLFRIAKGKKMRFELYSDPGSNFIDFMNYKDGALYIGTNNGLYVVSDLTSNNLNIKRLGIHDGVIDLETNLNSGFFDRKGDFWFGTPSGLVCYNPHHEGDKNSRPRVNFVSILLNYAPFEYSKYSEDLQSDGFPRSLTLPFSRNNLIFELDGVSLENLRALNYQYKLEGLSDDWSPLSESPTITFTSLQSGAYVLHVRSVDIDGRLSDELQFPFTINPPFYRTWWFILLCSFSIVGMLILIFRFRIKRIAQINEQEKLVYKSRLLALEQKSMNASMNRHFIFNSLNSIQYFINTQDRLSANKYLTNFANLIRKNLDSATAVGNVISLEEELERLELYLSLEAMRFKNRFDYKISVKDVDVESVMIPPMLMQPFIENSIIHGILPEEGKKGEILIDVFSEDDYLNIVIKDNGIGIHKSISRKYTSDGDHRSQGMEITSKRIELIQKISNNGISLEGPEEIVGNDGSINGTYVLIKIPLTNLDI